MTSIVYYVTIWSGWEMKWEKTGSLAGTTMDLIQERLRYLLALDLEKWRKHVMFLGTPT